MDPWVQSFGRGMNKTSAAILPSNRGLCSSSFHPFLPSPAPLSLYLTMHSFLWHWLFASEFFFSPFTHIHAAPHPSWISAKHYSLQNSAHPGVCQRSRWGPLFQYFFFFFFLTCNHSVTSAPPWCWTNVCGSKTWRSTLYATSKCWGAADTVALVLKKVLLPFLKMAFPWQLFQDC